MEAAENGARVLKFFQEFSRDGSRKKKKKRKSLSSSDNRNNITPKIHHFQNPRHKPPPPGAPPRSTFYTDGTVGNPRTKEKEASCNSKEYKSDGALKPNAFVTGGNCRRNISYC